MSSLRPAVGQVRQQREAVEERKVGVEEERRRAGVSAVDRARQVRQQGHEARVDVVAIEGAIERMGGREWAIAVSLGPDPSRAASDECDVSLDTWLAGRVRVTLRRVPQPPRGNQAWRWQLVRAIKIDDKSS